MNCPTYFVILDYLTDMSMLELTVFHFIVTKGQNTSPSKLTVLRISHVSFLKQNLIGSQLFFFFKLCGGLPL